MSKTYRRTSDGQLSGDGGRHYATPRYRPGTRRKPRRIVANGVRRQPPDLERLGEAIIRAAASQAANTAVKHPARPGTPPRANLRPSGSSRPPNTGGG
jgi:hypothetical protein